MTVDLEPMFMVIHPNQEKWVRQYQGFEPYVFYCYALPQLHGEIGRIPWPGIGWVRIVMSHMLSETVQ